jgi:hypothetical protein
LLTAALVLAPLQLHLVPVKRAAGMVALPLILAAAAVRGVIQAQAVTRKIIHLALPGLAAAAVRGVGIQGAGLLLAAAVAV